VKVYSCYEAGRDGFWLHRWLAEEGIDNIVVDSSSIEVNRRARRAKTDRLDGDKLLAMLLRYTRESGGCGRSRGCPQLRKKTKRRAHRELERLRQERTAHSNRIGSLLVLHNLRVKHLGGRNCSAGGRATRRSCPRVCVPRSSASAAPCLGQGADQDD